MATQTLFLPTYTCYLLTADSSPRAEELSRGVLVGQLLTGLVHSGESQECLKECAGSFCQLGTHWGPLEERVENFVKDLTPLGWAVSFCRRRFLDW